MLRLSVSRSFGPDGAGSHRRRRVGQVLSAYVLALTLGGTAVMTASAADPGKAPHDTQITPAPAGLPSVALHYGHDAPLNELSAFDIVVVEPAHKHDPARHQQLYDGRSALFAYVSIGEVSAERPYGAQMPATMFAGRNPVWDSRIVNQAHPDWPAFFAEQIVAPLWARGYRGFFHDTMDSYHAIGGDPEAVKAQQDGLVRAIQAVKSRFPQARLISNRGFELLPRIKTLLQAVAAESLFGRWDQEKQAYGAVPEADRAWILARLRDVQAAGLQAIAIDYANPGNRQESRNLASKIKRLGITPYVTSGDLASTGIGSIEVVPRRVLMIHNTTPDDDVEQASTAHLRGVMPLQYLGYRVDMLDLHRFALPDVPLADRYAAIVGFFEDEDETLLPDLTRFLTRALDEKVPVVLLNDLGIDPFSPLALRLGLAPLAKRPTPPVSVSHQAISGEIAPLPNVRGTAVRSPEGSQSLLTLMDASQQTYDGAAVTPWGGFAVRPYTFVPVDYGVDRWVIDPIDFYEKTIGRGDFRPIPDVTTENGRRLLLVHIDGDGFASRAEIPGTPFAAEVMYRDFIKRYQIPHTVSVIEGETGPKGLYPKLSPDLEDIARRIFRLDHVELASHSYSHPFFWHSVVANAASGNNSSEAESLQHLPIPGYNFDLNRDIAGSVDYINSRLAPPGKKTKVFLWTGDCVPPGAAVKA
ncbi:MAG: endo alpha-1,4 polygalactosaminidase, partial [Burkholderiaceae bacterium]